MLADCINASIILPNPIPDDLSPYMKIDQHILFEVQSFDVDHTFIQGTITEDCIEKMKETIELINFDEGKL
jgi:hypothetical protein